MRRINVSNCVINCSERAIKVLIVFNSGIRFHDWQQTRTNRRVKTNRCFLNIELISMRCSRISERPLKESVQKYILKAYYDSCIYN